MSGWDKQEWIKDILAKSGSELKEIKEENDINKMVYYTALPLIMQTEQPHGCSNNQITAAINYNQVPQASHNNLLNSHSQQQQQQNDQISQQQINSNTIRDYKLKNSRKPQFECDQCHMCFGSKSAHTSHMKSHVKQYQVQNTNNVVTPTNNVVQNIIPANTSSNPEPYQCDVCKKTFAVPARLVRHYRTHTGERPFACEFCNKTFSVKENLQVHRRIHTKERPYKCDVCGRAFEHSGKLHRHMRIHTGERPHKCSVCGKTFIQSGQLVIHMRTHTGEKPYKCPEEKCGKGFTCSKQLKVHSRTHTGEKPYHCDICFRHFGYNHVLKLHRVQHYGSKCYKCTICDETFKNKKEMESHIKGHANDMPDDEDEANERMTNVNTDTSRSLISSPSRTEEDSISISTENLSETPKDSGSEVNSDVDEVAYYNMYSRFENSMSNFTVQGGVDPALLAAASMASASNAVEAARNTISSPPLSHSSSSMQPPLSTHLQQTSTDRHFDYEPLAVMRQHGYFTPAPHSSEFKPSVASANLVRRVEEAIAIAEPLLTPPRSSPESPDRSSSPESDSLLMADRDIMSLPPRKRKLYLKDNQDGEQSSNMRLSSVIQFAKAS